MAKNLLTRILLISLSVLIIIGIVLMIWVYVTAESRNEIKVVLKDGKTEVVRFEDLALVPAGSCEYIVKLKGENAKQYDVSLDFFETEHSEEITLNNFTYVKIIASEKIVYEDSLITAIKNEPIVLPVDFNTDLNTEITVIYYMPVNVGNEASNTESAFALRVTASNE